MPSQTVWSCKLSFTLWILILTHWNLANKQLIHVQVCLYLKWPLNTQYFHYFSQKCDIFYSVLLFSCISFTATLERGLHFLVLLFSLQKKNSFLYYFFALLYFFSSHLSILMTVFLTVFLSYYVALYYTLYSTLAVFLAWVNYLTLYSIFSSDIK